LAIENSIFQASCRVSRVVLVLVVADRRFCMSLGGSPVPSEICAISKVLAVLRRSSSEEEGCVRHKEEEASNEETHGRFGTSY
jgi:hypothetical protein